MSRFANTPEEAPSGSALDALLRAEEETAQRLARAQADAAALIAAATDEAEAEARRARAALDAELAAVDAAHVETMRAMEQEVAQSAANTVARYRTISDELVGRLAAIVLSDVAGLPARAAP